jgi:Icc-related predicted phosphoesterase
MVRWLRIQSLRSGPPDIVLTHAPAAGCHDGQDLCHRGFESFNTAIHVWRPSFFVHGHVHAYDRSWTVTTIGCTTVLNAYPYRIFEASVRS